MAYWRGRSLLDLNLAPGAMAAVGMLSIIFMSRFINIILLISHYFFEFKVYPGRKQMREFRLILLWLVTTVKTVLQFLDRQIQSQNLCKN